MPATLFDFRDLDLMLKVRAEADADGWVETAYLAAAMGLGDEASVITSRLSWMKRYGMLDFDPKTRMWRLTRGGERVTDARLRAAQRKTIEALPDDSMIEVMANVTTRFRNGSAMTAQMIRREFLYGTRPR